MAAGVFSVASTVTTKLTPESDTVQRSPTAGVPKSVRLAAVALPLPKAAAPVWNVTSKLPALRLTMISCSPSEVALKSAPSSALMPAASPAAIAPRESATPAASMPTVYDTIRETRAVAGPYSRRTVQASLTTGEPCSVSMAELAVVLSMLPWSTTGVSTTPLRLMVKRVFSVLPALFRITSATPAASAERLPVGSAFTTLASAVAIASSVSPATMAWLKVFVCPAMSSATDQRSPTTGWPLRITVLRISAGHGVLKLTV